MWEGRGRRGEVGVCIGIFLSNKKIIKEVRAHGPSSALINITTLSSMSPLPPTPHCTLAEASFSSQPARF